MSAAAAGEMMNHEPFDLAPAAAQAVGAAALCIHGLTSTPGEVRPVGEELAKRGIRAIGPTLPGHNATPAELARQPDGAWLECVRGELGALQREADKVFVAGVSLGGLLGLALASEAQVDGLAVVGVPLDFGWHKSWLPGLLKHFVPHLQKRRGPDIRDDAARERHVSYPVLPLASIHQLVQLQRTVRSTLGKVSSPLLIAYGRHDRTARPSDAERIYAEVSSEDRQRVVLPDSGHIVTVDVDGRELCALIGEFFSDLV
jgi:carboxylesterase